MRKYRDKWSATFTLVFAVQLLVSALCIIPSAQAAVAIEANHCHEAMQHNSGQHMQHETDAQPMQPQSEQLPMSACSHCASPESVALFANGLDLSPADLLLAFVVVETPVTTTSATASPNFMESALAPPRSSTTLYTTTQRIRI